MRDIKKKREIMEIDFDSGTVKQGKFLSKK